MEKFNGVREISKGLFRAMVFHQGKHIHIMDGSEEDCEDAIDDALTEFRKKDRLNK